MKLQYRLKKNEDFQKVIKQKKSIACPTLVLYYANNNLGFVERKKNKDYPSRPKIQAGIFHFYR